MMNAFIQERDLFAPIVPFANGHLPRDRHHIYYEECGNRHGIPILFLHGGPGAGTVPMHRRLLNPIGFASFCLITRLWPIATAWDA